MKRVACVGGPLGGQYVTVDDHAYHVQTIAKPEPTIDITADPCTIAPYVHPEFLTYSMHRLALCVPHMCVRGATLEAWWYVLTLQMIPDKPDLQLMHFVTSGPPHGGWLPGEERPMATEPWWFMRVWEARWENNTFSSDGTPMARRFVSKSWTLHL